MPNQRINLDAYIPFYEHYNKIQDMGGGALHIYLQGDREIHTDAVYKAIAQNLGQFGMDPNEEISVQMKSRKVKYKRLKATLENARKPHTFKWRPNLRFVVIRMPEAGFTLNFSRRTVQVFQRAGWKIEDPFPLFVRNYLISINYPKWLKELSATNYPVRQWILVQWKKIKELDEKRILLDKYHERRALARET